MERLCNEVAAKVVTAGLPYTVLESRLRLLAVDVLMPQPTNRVVSPGEAADLPQELG